MGFNKADIIKGVLYEQADVASAQIEVTKREASEHAGAASALAQLAQQMPSMAEGIEARIEADKGMSSDTAQAVRVYAKNIIARFQTMCSDNSKHQQHCKLRAEGQLSMLEKMRDGMIKKGDNAVAVAQRREEVDEENRARAAADLPDPEDTKSGFDNAEKEQVAGEKAKEIMAGFAKLPRPQGDGVGLEKPTKTKTPKTRRKRAAKK